MAIQFALWTSFHLPMSLQSSDGLNDIINAVVRVYCLAVRGDQSIVHLS